MSDDRRQLDLLGGGEPRAARGVTWARWDAPGKVGWAPADTAVDAFVSAKARVLVAAVEDVSALADAAGEHDIDVRPVPLEDGAPTGLDRHVEALAADLRGGRKVVVLGADPSFGPWLAARALLSVGASPDEASEAVGGLTDAQRAWMAGESPEDPASDAPDEAAPPEAAPAVEADAALSESDAAEPDDPAEPAPEPVTSEIALPAEPDSGDASFEDRVTIPPPAALPADDDEIPTNPPPPPATFDDRPTGSPPPLDPALDWAAIARDPRRSRLVGTVLGAAIGDAMGHPTEFISSFEAIRERYGPNGVEGFELFREEGGARFAPYTDDTQMAECVLRALLHGRDSGLGLDATMRHLATLFIDWSKNPQGGHRAPGNACLAGCRNLDRGTPWSEAGGPTAGGCGSVMRAYPFGLVFADDLQRAERWAVAHSKLTHRDPIALAASAAMAIGVARVMRGDAVSLVLSEMVAAACRYSPRTAGMMARAIDEAQNGVGPETTLKRLEGWAAHEAIAAGVYLFARHPDDPRAAILEGANTPGDSDSLATLVGALCGARLGLAAIPADWVRDVERAGPLAELAIRI
ncbi:MAG: ADP-ribosylglycohydrolase family protein [Sandaracinaceae bacterium]